MTMDRPWEGLFSEQRYAFRFAARAGDPRRFFAASPENDDRLELRREILESFGDRHAFQERAAHAAVAELGDWAGTPGLDVIGLAQQWEQDFMVLCPDEDGVDVLVAGAVCFPSSWTPSEKVGLPVHTIHGVVPTLNDSLGGRIATFLSRVSSERAFERANWGLSASPQLNQHPALGLPRLVPPLSLDQVWLRREDQVLFRLPETKALIFGIDVRVIPVAAIAADPDGAAGLHRALATMPAEIATYKGINQACELLAVLLAERFD
jgi:hypothetical protein